MKHTIRFSPEMKDEFDIVLENRHHFTKPAEQEFVNALDEVREVGDEYEVTLSTEALRVFVAEACARARDMTDILGSEEYPVYHCYPTPADVILRADHARAQRALRDAVQAQRALK